MEQRYKRRFEQYKNDEPEVLNVSDKERQVSYLEYKTALRKIAEHPFVAEASRAKREEAGQIMSEIQDVFHLDELAFVPLGSVGVGLALPESDIDGIAYYQKSGKFVHPTEISHYLEEKYGLRYKHIFPINVQRDLLEESSESLASLMVRERDLAYVFAPSLNEFQNKEEERIMDDWRRRILQTMRQLYGDRRMDKFWEAIKQEIIYNLVEYEQNPLMRKNRRGRMEENVKAALEQRFPNNPEAQARAVRFLKQRRASFKLPSYQEMLKAYS